MPHIHRFFVSPGSVTSNEIVLSDDEAHHALRVVRVRVGDTVCAFDGAGRAWNGEIAELTRHDARIAIGEAREVPPPTSRLTLLQAALHRPAAIEDIVKHGTEVGISRFVFFKAQRSERIKSATAKWQKIAIEACKQCGRLWLPTFESVASLDAALDSVKGPLLVASKDLPSAPLRFPDGPNEIGLVVGPEGDFSPEEIETFVARGARTLSLGAHIYRSEVAALLAATVIQYELGEMGPR